MVAYLNEIYLLKGFVASGLLNIENANDVLVVKVAQELHLSESPQAEHGVIKGSNLLDGHLLSGRLMYRRTRSRREKRVSNRIVLPYSAVGVGVVFGF